MDNHAKNSCDFSNMHHFVSLCSYLAKNAGARNLVTLKEDNQCLFVRFNDMPKIVSICRDFKNVGKKKWKMKKWKRDNFGYLMAKFEKEGLLTKLESGKENGKDYLEYEVKDSKFKENYTTENEKEQVAY